MKRLVLIICCLSLFIFQSCHKEKDDETGIDGIEIISVSPSASLEDGVEYTFSVNIEYDLATLNAGIIMIGFNTLAVNSYTMIYDASVIVDKGSDVHTFTVTVAAKDWAGEGDFKVLVTLSEYPLPSQWVPLDTDISTLSFSK